VRGAFIFANLGNHNCTFETYILSYVTVNVHSTNLMVNVLLATIVHYGTNKTPPVLGLANSTTKFCGIVNLSLDSLSTKKLRILRG